MPASCSPPANTFNTPLCTVFNSAQVSRGGEQVGYLPGKSFKVTALNHQRTLFSSAAGFFFYRLHSDFVSDVCAKCNLLSSDILCDKGDTGPSSVWGMCP